MKPDCCTRERAPKRIAKTAGLSLFPGLLLVFAPKCPLCLAAYLSVFGIGAGAASLVAPWIRPFAIALLVLIAAATLYRTLTRRVRTEA